MAPTGPDLSVLLTVLAEQRIEVELTSDVGAGVALASVDLEGFDFAIAAIPSAGGYDSAGLPAIYIEIGVVAGRKLPLLIIAEPAAPSLPALAGLATVVTQFGNQEAMSLQVGLFVRQIHKQSIARRLQPLSLAESSAPTDYPARLRTVRTIVAEHRFALEQLVGDILRDAGAQVEQGMSGPGDMGVDAAAFIPGEEDRLGAVLIQVKSGTLRGDTLRDAEKKLSIQVSQTRAGLGLLIYDQLALNARKTPPTPLVARLGIEELLAALEVRPLRVVLTEARNRAVHGM
jgi:hypothetical protein